MTNELIHETSPYLLQHANNPVHWKIWSDAVLNTAKELDRPILVSIGYAACHWCHVMEKESFENEEIAAYMNENFICIKIDREERPDLDHIYIDAVQTLTGSAGWPLNVFLNTDGLPFFGGTYFPPTRMHNRSSWLEILSFITEVWKNRRSEVELQAKKITNHIQNTNIFLSLDKKVDNNEFNDKACIDIYNSLDKSADKLFGGFGTAPKFPQFFSLKTMLLHYHFFKNKDALNHVIFSVNAMLNGGIYDHLAGGIARYSTDEKWFAPHFEKMLYDNALLIMLLSDLYQITQDNLYLKALEKTISFCDSELKCDEGGFYASIDADTDGEEGFFYVWEKKEIETVLGESANLFCDFYGVQEKGNWEKKNILFKQVSLENYIDKHQLDKEKIINLIDDCETKLLAFRNTKNKPIQDIKILLGWNALMIKAFCKAAAASGNNKYKKSAIKLHEKLKNIFFESGELKYHCSTKNKVSHSPYLDDYAYWIQACIALQEITGNQDYLTEAKLITEKALDYFFDSATGYFFYTSKFQGDVIVRKHDYFDNAIPSGNSIMAENLRYLSFIFSNKDWLDKSYKMTLKLKNLVTKHPNSFGNWCALFYFFNFGEIELVITGQKFQDAIEKINTVFLPNKIFQSSNEQKDFPYLLNKKYNQEVAGFICKNNICLIQHNSIEKILNSLQEINNFKTILS